MFIIKQLANKKDINAALDLAYEVFIEFQAPYYSEEGVKSFKDFIFLDTQIRRLIFNGEAKIWGCYFTKGKKNSMFLKHTATAETMIGMAVCRDCGHISLAFVKKEYHRKGAGKLLFERLKEYAESNNCDEITVNASHYGIPFYKSLGFAETDMECITNGIVYIPMSLIINDKEVTNDYLPREQYSC